MCSKYLTQPILDNDSDQWTGKFTPVGNLSYPISEDVEYGLKRILFRFDVIDDGFVDGNIPVFTINIFDSQNKSMADAMYFETTKDTYFKEASPLVTSIFRSNRYFLGRNIVR